MNRIIMLLAILLFAGNLRAGDMTIKDFEGLWAVDYDRTMEEAKKSPKYDGEQLPKMIKRMMGMMKIRLSESEMTYVRGSREATMPFTIGSATTDTVVLDMKQGDQAFTITLKLIDGSFMNFKSSASDDMHFYIWKKAE